MKKLLLFLYVIFATSFSQAQQYVIKVKLTGFKDSTKFKLNDLETESDIDSAVIINNTFTLKGSFFNNEPQSLWLTTNYQGTFYYTTLFIANDNVTVTGDIKDMPFDVQITGSKSQDIATIYNKQAIPYYKQRDALVHEYIARKDDSLEVKRIWKTIGKIDSNTTVVQRKFILHNLNSYAGLDQLNYSKESFSRDTLQLMYNSLQPVYKQSKYGKRILNYIKVGKLLQKGDQYVDFEGIDKTGKSHKLSDIKGKYILLDFSTTNCGPCVESVGDMKKLSQKYPDQLAIITYSCDASKNTWLSGVKRDNPNWLSLWDGQGNYGKTPLKYGVNGYPTFCIVDPQGKIVLLSTGYGEGELEKTFAALLAK